MDICWEKMSQKSNTMQKWLVQWAAIVCVKECSWLSDRESEGPHFEDAKYLRVSPRNILVNMVNNFHINDLMEQYKRVTPNLHDFLKVVISKESPSKNEHSQNPNHKNNHFYFVQLQFEYLTGLNNSHIINFKSMQSVAQLSPNYECTYTVGQSCTQTDHTYV